MPAGRVIWYLQTGEDPGKAIVDHKDRNRMNNCWSNLRLGTHAQNCWNRSGVKGYSKNRNSWMVCIRDSTVTPPIILFQKCYKTEKEAAKAYCDKIKELRGDFIPEQQQNAETN